MNKNNFKKLRDHLRDNVTDDEFRMNHYRMERTKHGFLLAVDFIDYDNCGTVGCALGHAPFVPGLEPIESDFLYPYDTKRLSFLLYGMRVFDINKDVFDFLFGPRNYPGPPITRQHVIDRINEYAI